MLSSRRLWRMWWLLAGLGSSVAVAGPPAPAPSDSEADAEKSRGTLPEGITAGPGKVKLGANAELEVPEGAFFANAEKARSMLEKAGNLTSGREVGMVVTDHAEVVFEFDDVGFVKDDDKDSLDADKMLESLREGQEMANVKLKSLGRPELSIDRWQVKPHYDASTHNLEWGPVVKNKENGNETVNYNVRLLGRRGVMEVALLVNPSELDSQLPWFRQLLQGYEFTKGEDYASFRSGDKVAAYGLAALVTGGAVAVAAKSGLLAKLWKPIALGLAALAAVLKKLFSRKSSSPLEDDRNRT